jgi:hypothetical protein
MVYLRTPRLAASLLILFAAGTAQAQSIMENASNPADPKKAIANEAARSRRPALPAGLPGARGDAGVAPPTAALGSMKPTEALFDAVNRGDVAGARDALSRGADIDGRNILGLTALELAIDLGRNDLTFLLLSLRNGVPGARTAKADQTAAAAPVAVRPAPVAKPVAAVAARTVAPQPMRATVRYAGDPGTPAPAAGFLGFGGTTQ